MIIREILNNITVSLKSIYSINEAQTIAEWLIMDVLHIQTRFELFEKFDHEIEKESFTFKVFEQKWKRLLRNEPIQYVLHKAWFLDLEFYVNSYVLIPRPETEELCRLILKESDVNIKKKILDIGTGSGCIAVTLKYFAPMWDVCASDVSDDALKIARCNANKFSLDVTFIKDSILHSQINEKYDLIVSNPPYIPQNEMKSMHSNVVQYEPHIALFVPENDPLMFYKAIISFANNGLNRSGVIYTEIHENYSADLIHIFSENNYETKLYRDIHNKPRIIKAIKL
ncbi:MAG: peptide chain release factor N(5)-glutamine methyltransferase [Bacteroidales bacterium]|nr:peptide chain release factor N(5)-glutamine methyltransferase [Bacteroidales bacterium]